MVFGDAETAGAISAAVVGVAGIAGGILTAWLSNRSQRAQRAADRAHELAVLEREQASGEQRELRNEMLNAAAALAGDLTSAYFRLARLSERRLAESLDEIQRTLDSATLHLGRVSLLFGPRTRTTQAAESAYTNIGAMFGWRVALIEKREAINPDGARQEYDREDKWAGENIADFKRLAFADAEAVLTADAQPRQGA